jgi:hypothetical protein
MHLIIPLLIAIIFLTSPIIIMIHKVELANKVVMIVERLLEVQEV